jgi:sulfur-oxidizing protein SoxY
MSITRREFGVLTAGAAAFAAIGGAAFAAATEDAIVAFTGGATPTEGMVRLTAPEIAENGNTVPIEVSVDAAPGSGVVSVMVLASGNPAPDVASFTFTALSGEAKAATRIRLAKTQDVIAVAKMADGSTFIDRREVKVTIGGCGG